MTWPAPTASRRNPIAVPDSRVHVQGVGELALSQFCIGGRMLENLVRNHIQDIRNGAPLNYDWTAIQLTGEDQVLVTAITAVNPEDIGQRFADSGREVARKNFAAALQESPSLAELARGRDIVFALAYGGNTSQPDEPTVGPVRLHEMYREADGRMVRDWFF